MPVQTMLDVTLLLLVTLAGVHDLVSRRIPNLLLLFALCAALPLQAAIAPGALLDALAGAACGLFMFLPLYLLRGMAAGDVKLLATVGAFVGAAATFEIAVLTWCFGGLMALLMIIARGQARAAFVNLRELLRPVLLRLAGFPVLPGAALAPARASVGNMPYGVAIAMATIVWVWRHLG